MNPEESEHAQDIEDLTNELRRQHKQFTRMLATAIALIDQLMTEMRLANVVPSAGVIFTKAEFDRQMRILLGRQDDPDGTSGSGPQDRGGITG